jgi:hypothetical protein
MQFVGSPAEENDSICGFCGVGCRLSMGSSENHIIEVNPAHLSESVNGATLCVRGHFAHDYLDSSRRLVSPLMRKKKKSGRSWFRFYGMRPWIWWPTAFKIKGGDERIAFCPVVSARLTPPVKNYPFTAIVGTRRYHLGSGTRTRASRRIKEFASSGQLEISPADATLLDLSDGDAAVVRSPWGEIRRNLCISSELKQGHVFVSTGLKWKFARQADGDPKYIVCNADEGDPGAFMDRAILEGDPHAVVEGMLIGAYAMAGEYGFIYVREEYPIAIDHLNQAIEQANELGLLGENILGLGFNFDLSLRLGAGAFVCGEETALMASIEGQRGMPPWDDPASGNFNPHYPCQRSIGGYRHHTGVG